MDLVSGRASNEDQGAYACTWRKGSASPVEDIILRA